MNLGGIIHLNKTSTGIFCVILLLIFFYIVSNKKDLKKHVELEELNKINLRELINIAITAAENGGREVIQRKDNIEIQKKGLTKEGLIDSVTTADFLSHCSMIRTLRYYYSSIKVVSEEAKTVCDDKQYINFSLTNSVDESVSDEFVEEKDVTVWIDPLDATHEYTGMYRTCQTVAIRYI